MSEESHSLATLDTTEMAIIRKTIAPNLTSDEFALFVSVCGITGLSPMAREIYPLKGRDGRLSIITGVDGFRRIAARSGQYAGQRGPFWLDADGVWTDYWIKDTPPLACKVGVLARGDSEPTWGIAHYKSAAKNTPTWQAMPAHMLSVRAECYALRRRFSRQMAMVQVDENDPGHDDTPGVTSSVVTPPAISAPVQRALTEADMMCDLDEDSAPDAAPAQPPPAPKPAAARTKPAPVGKPDAAKAAPAQPTTEAPATSESQRSASETPVVPDLTADDPLMVQARDIYKKCLAAKLNPTKPEPPLTEDRVIAWMDHWYQALDQHVRSLQKAQDEATPSQDEAWEDLGNGR